MAYFTWDDSYSVNVREIDLQHQKLVGMINEFYDSVGKMPDQALFTLIGKLVNYTQYHFSTEEKYFEQFSYPGTKEHTEEHRKFTAKVLDVKKKVEEGRLVISTEITSFLKNWLSHHIKEVDKAYSKCFNDHGLH